MNTNKIKPSGFSNPETRKEYLHKNKDGKWIENQCGGCSFFAPLNAVYGICCYEKTRFYLETVSEHFGCEKYVYDGYGWGCHAFCDDVILPGIEEMTVFLLECEKAFSCKKSVLTKQSRNFHLRLRHFLNKYKEKLIKMNYPGHPVLDFK